MFLSFAISCFELQQPSQPASTEKSEEYPLKEAKILNDLIPISLPSKVFCLLPPCQEAEIWPKAEKQITTISNDLDLIIGSKLNGKLTIEKNYMSVPFANWAGTERDWGCPSTRSLPNKDIHSVPGSLAQGRGRLLALCVEVALPTAHSWPASGAPPCWLWSSPFFLWPDTMSSIRSSRTAV